MQVEGKVAVVTGGARGIGRGMARCFAQAGMRVLLSDVDAEALGSTVAELAANGAEVDGVRTDVTRPDEVESLAAAALDRFGAVHVLCNNAGVAMPGPVGSIALEEWRWTLSVNLWGPIHGVQVFLPLMERQGEGHICSTASESGLYATPMLGAYNVSKHGVVGLMTSLQRDLRARGSAVRASVLCPGAVATHICGTRGYARPASMARHLEDAATARFWEDVTRAVARGMDPDEVGAIVLDAIRRDRFWIFTHPHVPETALRQARVMAGEQRLCDLDP